MMAPLSQPGCLNHEISKIQNKRKGKRTRVGPTAAQRITLGFGYCEPTWTNAVSRSLANQRQAHNFKRIKIRLKKKIKKKSLVQNFRNAHSSVHLSLVKNVDLRFCAVSREGQKF